MFIDFRLLAVIQTEQDTDQAHSQYQCQQVLKLSDLVKLCFAVRLAVGMQCRKIVEYAAVLLEQSMEPSMSLSPILPEKQTPVNVKSGPPDTQRHGGGAVMRLHLFTAGEPEEKGEAGQKENIYIEGRSHISTP